MKQFHLREYNRIQLTLKFKIKINFIYNSHEQTFLSSHAVHVPFSTSSSVFIFVFLVPAAESSDFITMVSRCEIRGKSGRKRRLEHLGLLSDLNAQYVYIYTHTHTRSRSFQINLLLLIRGVISFVRINWLCFRKNEFENPSDTLNYE